jgi:predicted DNA-binding transcriptional regulator AlpA
MIPTENAATEAAPLALIPSTDARVPTINAGSWITKDHAAVLLGVSTRTLDTMIKTGTAPSPYKFNARRVRYAEHEFRAWLATRNGCI